MAAVVSTRASVSSRVAFVHSARPVARPVVAAAARCGSSDAPIDLSRRVVLATPLLVSFLAKAPRAHALQGFKTFLGYSQAPDLYLGYGQANDAPPLYTFDYPIDWAEWAVTKTDKSTMGMDGRVTHPKTHKELAYVVALGGKDYRDSVLKDGKTALSVIAGGDPDMRQAVTDGTVTQVQQKINGTDMFMFDIASDKRHYLSTIGKKGDTVFALVVTAPSSAFAKDAEQLHHIQDSFKLL